MAYYGGGGMDSTRNRAPSHARANGKEAIREALQHHVDRLQPNRTKAAFSMGNSPRMSAASPGAIQMAQANNAAHPNQTFFTPSQSRQASAMGRRNNPLGALGDRAEGFLQLRQTGKQLTQMFDPRSRAGIANIATTFAGGGPEGLGEEGAGMGGRLPEGMVPYNIPKAANSGALHGADTGVPSTSNVVRIGQKVGRLREFGKTEQQLLMDSLTRRAQGVGRYGGSKAGPLDFLKQIEQGREAQVNRNQWMDENKFYANERGAAAKKSFGQKRINDQLSQHMGGDFAPAYREQPFYDTQPHDYTDRLKAVQAYQRNPELGQAFGGSPDPIKQALYDMLFGGKGLLRRPSRPGPSNPSGSPYGGGPFG